MRDIVYNIYILVIFIFITLLLFDLMNINFVDSEKKIVKEIIYENFSTQTNNDSFCSTSKNSIEQEKKCNNLTNDNCLVTNCCVLLNDNKCVSGSITGPSYHTDDNGKDINMLFYKHKNKCYGDCKND